jgi:hypothetical protein
MASPLFFECLRHNLSLEHFFKVHLLQMPIFFFQFCHALYHGHIHSAVLGPPFIKSRRADALLAANIWCSFASFNSFD